MHALSQKAQEILISREKKYSCMSRNNYILIFLSLIPSTIEEKKKKNGEKKGSKQNYGCCANERFKTT